MFGFSQKTPNWNQNLGFQFSNRVWISLGPNFPNTNTDIIVTWSVCSRNWFVSDQKRKDKDAWVQYLWCWRYIDLQSLSKALNALSMTVTTSTLFYLLFEAILHYKSLLHIRRMKQKCSEHLMILCNDSVTIYYKVKSTVMTLRIFYTRRSKRRIRWKSEVRKSGISPCVILGSLICFCRVPFAQGSEY